MARCLRGGHLRGLLQRLSCASGHSLLAWDCPSLGPLPARWASTRPSATALLRRTGPALQGRTPSGLLLCTWLGAARQVASTPAALVEPPAATPRQPRGEAPRPCMLPRQPQRRAWGQCAEMGTDTAVSGHEQSSGRQHRFSALYVASRQLSVMFVAKQHAGPIGMGLAYLPACC